MSVNETQALILAPTRELVQQTQKVVLEIGKYMNIKCCACIGGTKVVVDVETLENGVHVVVGTPGRVLSLINRKALVMDKIKIFCVDEADEMLAREFKRQIMKGRSLPKYMI